MVKAIVRMSLWSNRDQKNETTGSHFDVDSKAYISLIAQTNASCAVGATPTCASTSSACSSKRFNIFNTASRSIFMFLSFLFLDFYFWSDVNIKKSACEKITANCFRPYKTRPSALVIHRLFFFKPPRG